MVWSPSLGCDTSNCNWYCGTSCHAGHSPPVECGGPLGGPCRWRKGPFLHSDLSTSASSLKLLVQKGSDQSKAHKYAPSAAGGPSPALKKKAYKARRSPSGFWQPQRIHPEDEAGRLIPAESIFGFVAYRDIQVLKYMFFTGIIPLFFYHFNIFKDSSLWFNYSTENTNCWASFSLDWLADHNKQPYNCVSQAF